MKNAIVTGGTKGIGLSCAKMLLEKGYHVILTYAHDEAAAQKCNHSLSEISDEFEILKVDQSSRSDMRKFAELMISKKHIDCIVCNGGGTLRKEMTDILDQEWENVMAMNVNHPFYLIRDLYGNIPSGSRIVFIGSLMGIYPHGTSLAYGVTKSAVHSLAQNLVKCFEDTGTTVNVIAPGFVETEWQKDKPLEIRNRIYQKTAIKRFATVEEIADAVRFCIDNPFVNGSIIEVSGGYCFK